MNKDLAIVIGGISGITAIIGGVLVTSSIKNSKEKDKERQHELDMANARFEKELEEQRIMASFPDSYWEAKKAESEEKTKQVKIDADAKIQMEKDRLAAEKDMPEAYFNRDATVRKAEEEAKAAKYAADKEAETRVKEAEIQSRDNYNRQKHEEQLAYNERQRLTDMARENRWAIESMANAAANVLSK